MTQAAIHQHTYENGLTLLAEPMPWLESAAFSLLLPGGCVYESDELGGLAGLCCEMGLRGAGEHDSRALNDALDNLGVERSEAVSGAHTSFGGATLASSLEPALVLYADIVRRPHLNVDQLDASRAVCLQELQALVDEPAHRVMMELRRVHYPQPWGRSSQGEREGLEAATIDDVRGFVQRRWGPAEATLSVAGAVDWERIRDQVGALLGDWQPQPAEVIEERPAQAHHTHIDFASSQTQIGIAYDSVPYRHDDYFRAWGAVGALSGGMSSRLFTEVREKRGLCYSVYASYHTLRDRGAVFSYAGTTAERAQETLDVLTGELVRLGQGIEADEIDRLKARIKSALVMQQESSAARSGAITRDWYHLHRVRTLAEVSRLVDELTCDSINTYLAEHPPQDFTVVTLGPEPLEMPVGVS